MLDTKCTALLLQMLMWDTIMAMVELLRLDEWNDDPSSCFSVASREGLMPVHSPRGRILH